MQMSLFLLKFLPMNFNIRQWILPIAIAIVVFQWRFPIPLVPSTLIKIFL